MPAHAIPCHLMPLIPTFDELIKLEACYQPRLMSRVPRRQFRLHFQYLVNWRLWVYNLPVGVGRTPFQSQKLAQRKSRSSMVVKLCTPQGSFTLNALSPCTAN